MTDSKLARLRETFLAAVEAFPSNAQRTLDMRNPGEGAGSYFLTPQTFQSIADAIVLGHREDGFMDDPRISAVCRGIRFEGIPGVLGILNIKHMSEDTPMILINRHPRETDDFPELCLEVHIDNLPATALLKTEVSHGTIILSPHNGKEVVATFYPGCVSDAPVRIPDVTAFRDRRISKDDAILLGVSHIKVDRSLKPYQHKGRVKVTRNFIDLVKQENLQQQEKMHASVEAYGFSYRD